LNTPVLFLIYNRPEHSLRVLQAIRETRPTRLFLAADGPKASVEGDSELCKQTRKHIDGAIDWECDVRRLYRDENLGCKIAVSSAIDWFFSEVDEGIILEDDTLPTRSFFRFAETMLERYRDDATVLHVSGNNHQHGRIRGNGAYYASRFAHSWGWATWRRAWNLYDITMLGFPEEWDRIAASCSLPWEISEWWKMWLHNTRLGVINTWDFQWHYTVMKNQGVCLIPNRNLVENIGVGDAATHMKKLDVASSIKLAHLAHFYPPSSLEICQKADKFDFDYSVTNQKTPWRNLNELVCSWKFEHQQRNAGISGISRYLKK